MRLSPLLALPLILSSSMDARAADEAPVATATLPAGVWAVVDSRTIAKEDVLLKARVLPGVVPPSQRESFVLDALIDEIVIANALDREGIGPGAVSDAEIDKLIQEAREYAKRMGVDFDAFLKQQGETLDQRKAKARVALAFQKRVEKDATDDALRAWFAKHDLELAGEARATEILIAPRGDDTATFMKALQVLARVAADGSNVAQLARDVSEDVNAPIDSGDLDWFAASSGVAPPEVVAACFALGKRGLVPRPVRSHRGYHVVYVTGTRFTQPPKLETHREQVRQRFLYERTLELRKEWRAAAHIELAADAPKIKR